jgi:hypothetical protein
VSRSLQFSAPAAHRSTGNVANSANRSTGRLRYLAIVALTTPVFLAAVGECQAAPPKNVDPAKPLDLTLDAGLACPGFALRIQSDGPAVQVNKEFFDKNGSVVRLLSAGKGWNLTFTNTLTDASFTVKGNGSVSHTSVASDGVMTVSSTGHNGLIMFPTDVPPGPTSTLYSGRIVYTVDGQFITTIQQVSGKSIDICAVLSG